MHRNIVTRNQVAHIVLITNLALRIAHNIVFCSESFCVGMTRPNRVEYRHQLQLIETNMARRVLSLCIRID